MQETTTEETSQKSENNWMTPEMAADYLEISRSSFDRQIKAGTGPKGSLIPNTTILRWSACQIDEWMSSNRQR